MKIYRVVPVWLFLLAAIVRAQPGAAPAAPRLQDEGMWTFNNLPLKEFKEVYKFEPTEQWIEHVRLSSVRFGGASGAIVSADGLVITNHHVALGQLQKVSTPQNDYVRDGFYARGREQEMKCPDQELNVLVFLQDVTQRVLGAVDAKASDEDRNRQRKAEIARIEKKSTDATKLKSDVVQLYQGGEYWLYRYKKYTDVRLVMAPEYQAAFYGGDFDNFTYPRFCLDFAFFRLYEDGKPAQTEQYLKWAKTGVAEGDLVFVSGHPGSTNRSHTVAQLQYERDFGLPIRLRTLNSRRNALNAYATRGPEQARQVKQLIFGVENSIKSMAGRYESLKDAAVMQRLTAAEQAFRQQVNARPELAQSAGKSWDRISAAVTAEATKEKQLTYYALGGSQLLGIAKNIVLYVAEIEKPNDKRYEEYRESALPSLELRLFSPAPIYPELEEHLLATTLTEARDALGAQDKMIVAALGGREPKAFARELIAGSKLIDPGNRRALVKGGRAAVDASTDPLIVLARKLTPMWRELRDWQENTVQSVEVLEGGKIARARFAVYGHETYPDATGTLRMSFGRVMGFELGTTRVPFKTTLFGLFDRAGSFDNRAPFNLSALVAQHRGDVDMNTPLDYVLTADIVGGNSGSPVINRAGEYVGAIFDGNIQGLGAYYVYTDQVARAVAVDSRAVIEALKKIYNMPGLVQELTGESASGTIRERL